MSILARNFMYRFPILRQNGNAFKTFMVGSVQKFQTTTIVSQIKVIPPSPEKERLKQLGYDERNRRLQREMSPHLTIYAPQLTSMMSISTRITGVAVAMFIWFIGTGYLLGSHDTQDYITMLEGLHMNSTSLSVGKFLFVLPFAYHSINGVRHLAWGYGMCLSLKQIYTTGYAVLAITPIVAAWLASL